MTNEQKQLLLQQSLKKICLSGSGKGRLQFLSGRYSFGYESLLEKKIKTWSLALNIPFSGEEIFKINYVNADKEEMIASGDFYRRLKKESLYESKSRYELEMLDTYLLGFSKFLKWYDEVENNGFLKSCTIFNNHDVSGDCPFGGHKLNWVIEDDLLELTFPIDADKVFALQAKQMNDTNYEQLKLFAKGHSRGVGLSTLQMELSQVQCQ